MERLFGTLFALSLVGGTATASAEPSSHVLKRVVQGQRPQSSPKVAGLEKLFDTADKDEIAYRAFLDRADADRDARVDVGEFEHAVQERVLARVAFRFKRLDRDGDGKVTHAEVPQMDRARFARFDADGDGAFTVGELTGALRVQVTRSCVRLIARLDFDRDGALSAADLERGGDKRLAKLELAALLKSGKAEK